MNDKKNRIPLWVKIVWIVIALLILSCAYPVIRNSIRRSRITPLQQVTHERVADLEQYVYDNVGPDIYFGEPEINDALKTVKLVLIEDPEDYHINSFDRARCLINDYLNQNAECFLNDDYRITLEYGLRSITPDGQDGYDTIARVYNYVFIDGEDTLMLFQLSNLSCSEIYSILEVTDVDSIQATEISVYGMSLDEVIEIVHFIPNLSYLYLIDWNGDNEDLMDAVYEVNSDIVVIFE